jgi:hypothetical protein
MKRYWRGSKVWMGSILAAQSTVNAGKIEFSTHFLKEEHPQTTGSEKFINF